MEHAIANDYHTRDLYYSLIQKCTERLEKGLIDGYLVNRGSITVDDKVFIVKKEHEHVLDIDDEVIIDDYHGIVEKREYDAVNDTMHYFTDIVVEIDYNKENNKKKIGEIKEEYLPKLENILKVYNPTQKKKERGFWRELLNL